MPKKVDKYIAERQDIVEKLLVILGINENNNMFSLHKIDNNVEKQNEIMSLQSDVKKYFICGSWGCFKKKDITKRRWLSLVKGILQNGNYNINSSHLVSKTNNSDHNGTIYFIQNISF